MIRFSCPKCDAKLKSPDKQAGRPITCPKCRASMHVPHVAVQQPQVEQPAEENECPTSWSRLPIPWKSERKEEVEELEEVTTDDAVTTNPTRSGKPPSLPRPPQEKDEPPIKQPKPRNIRQRSERANREPPRQPKPFSWFGTPLPLVVGTGIFLVFFVLCAGAFGLNAGLLVREKNKRQEVDRVMTEYELRLLGPTDGSFAQDLFYIDYSRCPTDFQQAWEAHRQALAEDRAMIILNAPNSERIRTINKCDETTANLYRVAAQWCPNRQAPWQK